MIWKPLLVAYWSIAVMPQTTLVVNTPAERVHLLQGQQFCEGMQRHR